MIRTTCLAAVTLLLYRALISQTSPSVQQTASPFPKPSFVLHDEKLHPQQPKTIFSPNGTGFVVSAGTSMIQVSSLSFSADGTLLAVGSTPGIVDLWDLRTRRKIRAFEGGTAVALSPDGRLLAKDGKGIEIIDISSGKVNRTIPWSNHSGYEDRTIQSMSFDSNGTRLLVASNGQDLKVFNVSTGTLIATLTNTRRGQFSPDGSLVIGGDYRHLLTWSTQSWQPVRDLPNGPDYVTTVAANPTRDLEVVGGPNSARLLKLTTGAELGTVGNGYTNFAALDRTGSRIFTYTSRGFAVWDATGKQYCLRPEMGNGIMALSPDNRWLAAAQGQLTDVAIWDVSSILIACSAQNSAAPDPLRVKPSAP
jgi:WD40 repeat protein